MRTYQTLNKNEVRAVEITIRDRDGQSFAPSGAFAEISKDGSVVVAEQGVYIDVNKIYTVVGTTVTSTIGAYKIKWRITKGTYTFYHVTELTVVEL